jgi:hypothetical protein
MHKLNRSSVALSLGAFVGVMHLLWSAVVALGFAQTWLDFIYRVHFVNNPFTVTAFSIENAVVLVAVTTIVGYIVGWIFAEVWNRLHNLK